MRIVLASQSALRKQALDILGLPYEIIPSFIDEKAIQGPDPYKRARMLAEAKARHVGGAETDAIIVAGDMFILSEGIICEKPNDAAEAIAMLASFSGRTIEVISGIAVFAPQENRMLSTTEVGRATFRTLHAAEIKDYVARSPVTTFAGAFDGIGLLRFAEHVEGSYVFPTGFPMHVLIDFLRKQGVNV